VKNSAEIKLDKKTKGDKTMRKTNFVAYFVAAAILLGLGTVINAQWVTGDALTKSTTTSISTPKTLAVIPGVSEMEQNLAVGTTDKKIIIGSWLETVTFNGPMLPLRSLSSFTADGCLIVADQGAVNSEVSFSAGHGSWSHAGGRTFDWTSVELLYSTGDGSMVRYLRVSGRYTVNETGNAYTGQFLASVSDPDGNVLLTVDGTNAGNRIQVQPLQ
jgi:hypothetical protein